jgi:HlyD family secretion protein
MPNPRSRRPHSYRLICALASVGALIFHGCRRDGGTSVAVESATIRTITQTVSATGKIQPEVEVKISAEVAGEILELPFRDGDTVRKGDLLVRIKSDNYEFLVEQREADLAATRAAALQAKARLAQAEDDLKRIKGLYDANLVAESEYTAARTVVEVAQAERENALAQIRRAEGTLKQAKDQLEKTTIYSPMDGTISSLTSEVGERVVATGQFTGTEVMRVADLANMELRVNVNENDIVNVKIGDPVRITIDAFADESVRGTVTEIASRATTSGQNTQEEVTRFEVRIRIDAGALKIRPGMSASAEIETRTVADVVSVPIQSVTVRSLQENKTVEQLQADRDKALQETQGEGARTAVNERQRQTRERADRASLQRVVFVVEHDAVKMVPVETGIQDTTHMEITSGVAAGDVVVSGNFRTITTTLTDGMKVQVEEKKNESKK